MTPQRLLDSRTELPAPLPPCEGRRVRQPAPQPSALGLAGSDACGVGPVCVPQGWPPRNRAARHTARSEKGKTGSGPEGGASAHGPSMESSQGPQSVLSPPTLPNLRRHQCALSPGRRAQQRESWSILLGAALRGLARGAGPQVPHHLWGEANHVEQRRGDSTLHPPDLEGTEHWGCCSASHGAWPQGRSPLSGFLGRWRVRLERDLTRQNLQTEMEPKAGWPREVAARTCGLQAAQAPGTRRPARQGTRHSHQQTASNYRGPKGIQRQPPCDTPRAAASSPSPRSG